MANISSLLGNAETADIIALGRKDVDNTDKAVKSRIALIDRLVSAGFTSANTLPKNKMPKGYNGEWKREALELIGAASVKIKGKRMTDADLKKFADEGVSNKVLLSGVPKGSMSKTVTWKGEAGSWMGKVRKSLEERENAAKAQVPGTPKMTKGPKEVFLDYLQKAYNMTFKTEAPAKDVGVTQKALREAAKTVGGTLSTPTKK